MNKNNEIFVYNSRIFIFRFYFTIFSWIIPIKTLVEGNALESIKYFTIQTNLLVAIWLTFATILYKNPQKYRKISGALKGAVTLYISVTFIVFTIILSPMMSLDTLFNFTNIVAHFIVPILFIIDWFLTENYKKYKWRYLLYWIIYPICYLIFVIFNGKYTGNYIYPFLDLNSLGIPFFFLSVVGITLLFLVLGIIFIAINHHMLKKHQLENSSTHLKFNKNL